VSHASYKLWCVWSLQTTTCRREVREWSEFGERREPALWVTLWVETSARWKRAATEMDGALEWGQKLARILSPLSIELRPFQDDQAH
jgi:hypothetical protein